MKKTIFFLVLFFVISCSGKDTPEVESTMELNEVLTSTPVPTLTVPMKIRMAEEYLKTNNDCALPCYWGIMPAQTNLEEAWQILGEFAKSRVEIREGYYRVRFALTPTDEEENYYLNLFTQPENNDLIVAIHGKLDQSLQEFLIQNGVPEKIYIQANGYKPEFAQYLSYLYYEEKGIWAKHIFRNVGITDIEQRTINICTQSDIKGSGFVNADGIEIILWNPSERTVAGDDPVKKFDYYGEFNLVKPIEDALGMSETEFYNKALKNNDDVCFLINTDEWQLIPDLIITPSN